MAKSLKARSLGPRGLGAGLGAWGAKGPGSYVLGDARDSRDKSQLKNHFLIKVRLYETIFGSILGLKGPNCSKI